MNRDIGIDLIRARPDRRVYGMGLGVMILDEVYPGFPGDVRNASAYPFPIQYEVMEGLNCYDGKCTYAGVAEAFGLEYTDPAVLLA